MLDRIEPILKIACLVLAGLLLFQLARLAFRSDPLGQIQFPSLHAPPSPQTPGPNTSSNSAPVLASTQPPQPSLPPGVAVPAGPVPGHPGLPPGMVPGGPNAPLPGPPVSPAVQARLDRIRDSEILGPVPRPLPMGLLGIVGNHVLLRAPNGQQGLLEAGGELGGVKLIRIGINRVLIEHEGELKELTLFAGFGSEALLPQQKGNQP